MAIYKSKKNKNSIKSRLSRKKTMKKNRKRVSKMRGGYPLGACGEVRDYAVETELRNKFANTGNLLPELNIKDVEGCKRKLSGVSSPY
jgi:hypothetical protein